MTSHLILFGRPQHEEVALPPLGLTGTFPNYVPAQNYEGRLQIINSVGKCKVDIVDANLPPGYKLLVDNFTKEVVLKWPAHQPAGDDTIINGNLEGDADEWDLGAGWTISADDPIAGAKSLSFANFKGDNSPAIANTRYEVEPGDTITLTCQIQQGASSAGNVRANVLLQWFTSAGLPHSQSQGNEISSASNGAVYPSTVTDQVPPGARFVSPGVRGSRRSQNHPLRVDSFTWTNTPELGQTSGVDYYIGLVVTDSLNRTVYYYQTLSYQSYFATSTPYQLMMPPESLDVGGELLDFLYRIGVQELTAGDRAFLAGSLIGFQYRDPVNNYTFVDPGVKMAGALTGFVYRVPVVPYAHADAGAKITGAITGFTYKEQPKNTYTEPGVKFTGALTGFTYT